MKPKAPITAMPRLVTLTMLLYSSLEGFLVIRSTRMASFINLFTFCALVSCTSMGKKNKG